MIKNTTPSDVKFIFSIIYKELNIKKFEVNCVLYSMIWPNSFSCWVCDDGIESDIKYRVHTWYVWSECDVSAVLLLFEYSICVYRPISLCEN